MVAQLIHRGDVGYPERLASCLRDDAPSVLHLCGDRRVLRKVRLGLVCSIRCPGSVIIQTFDAIRDLRNAGVIVAGGFHSPMECECLHFLLRGTQRVVLCPAVGIGSFALGPEEQRSVDEGRLAVLSIFDEEATKATPELALRRNEVVAALVDVLFVPHAVAGGKAEAVARRSLARGQVVLTLDDEENRGLIALGATPVGVRELLRVAGEVGVPTPSSGTR
jgi:predicted Rossmann fold nucleotide-binding protein DprA/Smf involved in DNA uptake